VTFGPVTNPSSDIEIPEMTLPMTSPRELVAPLVSLRRCQVDRDASVAARQQ
jgi:hypothetical protein